MREVSIIGAGMIRFGRFPERSVTDMGQEAVLAALKDAGISPGDVDQAFCGSVGSGMLSGQRIFKDLGLDRIPVTNAENACSSGSTAFRLGWLSVSAGLCDTAVVVGAEKLSRLGGGTVPLGDEDFQVNQGLVMPGLYAMRARRYMHEYGATVEDLAEVAVKNHQHSTMNPYAQYQKPYTREEILGSRMIADPFTLLQCCPTGDGAAAVVITTTERARRFTQKPVRVLASALQSGAFDNEHHDMTQAEISRRTAKEAYAMAGVGPEDVDVVELHDAFTIAELMYYEALGFCPSGEAPALLKSGATRVGGKKTVNPSGGLLSKGHPLGATGVAQMVEVTWHLRDQAGARQAKGARVGMTHCTGGGISRTDHGACTIHIFAR